MKLGFYPKLAADSIKKNKKLYLPYILTCCGISAMQYIMFYLSYYTENSGMIGGRTITTTLNYGIIVIVIFSIIFLISSFVNHPYIECSSLITISSVFTLTFIIS